MIRRALRRLGRWLEPLLAPDAEAQRARVERLAEQSREQQRLLKTLVSEIAAHRADVHRIVQSNRDDTLNTQARFTELRIGIRRHDAALRRLARRTGIAAEFELVEQRIVERLERLKYSSDPILVGPWTGEIGFELLYWIPFVRWAVQKFNLPPERLVVVSRGGTADWYSLAGSGYVDVFSVASVEEFRDRTESRKKQRSVNAFDREVIRRVRRARGDATTQLLHPAMMYALFMPFWKDQAPLTRVVDHVRYRRVEPARPAALPPLPARYIAARFYFSQCFPDTAENRGFVAGLLEALAEHHDVVLLTPGIRPDDHADYSAPSHPRVHSLQMNGHAGENLAWQSAVIAGAEAFIGTYGGFAYLAPFCGVRSVAFYSDRNYFAHHLDVAQRALLEVGGGTFEAIDVATVRMLDGILGGVVRTAR